MARKSSEILVDKRQIFSEKFGKFSQTVKYSEKRVVNLKLGEGMHHWLRGNRLPCIKYNASCSMLFKILFESRVMAIGLPSPDRIRVFICKHLRDPTPLDEQFNHW